MEPQGNLVPPWGTRDTLKTRLHGPKLRIIEWLLLLQSADKLLLAGRSNPKNKFPASAETEFKEARKLGLLKVYKYPEDQYRFSAFWLRSKCSICSYQLNI